VVEAAGGADWGWAMAKLALTRTPVPAAISMVVRKVENLLISRLLLGSSSGPTTARGFRSAFF
jgi:hypothetical protein